MQSSETSNDQDEAQSGDSSEELKPYAVLKNRIHDLLVVYVNFHGSSVRFLFLLR